MKKVSLFGAMTALVLLLAVITGGVAVASILIGTNDPETIIGTSDADQITGKGGDDILKGRAGNDVYHFDNGFGNDTIIDTETVGAQDLPGGKDTLSFSQYNGSGLFITIVPELKETSNKVTTNGGQNSVDVQGAMIEKSVGGSGSDEMAGGSQNNIYDGGPGGNDAFTDFGGSFSVQSGFIRESDDTYKGFTTPGTDTVFDYRGHDKIDLRPLESSDVSFDTYSGGLKITIDPSTHVRVEDYFSGHPIEQIIFSDQTVRSNATAKSMLAN